MRLTVGPLPPAVYWRRRALVVGVLLLVVSVIVYSCTGRPSPGTGTQLGTTSSTSTPTTTTRAPTSTPTASPTASPATATPTGAATTLPGTGPCTDGEILLTAAASPAVIQVGQTATFTLAVKNTSSRTCNRNIGSIPQELQLRLGDAVVWSSDECTNAKLYNYDQIFTPGLERRFDITWNGYRTRSPSGQQTCPTVPSSLPEPGGYQLVARLGGLYSAPVPVTIHSGA